MAFTVRTATAATAALLLASAVRAAPNDGKQLGSILAMGGGGWQTGAWRRAACAPAPRRRGSGGCAARSGARRRPAAAPWRSSGSRQPGAPRRAATPRLLAPQPRPVRTRRHGAAGVPPPQRLVHLHRLTAGGLAALPARPASRLARAPRHRARTPHLALLLTSGGRRRTGRATNYGGGDAVHSSLDTGSCMQGRIAAPMYVTAVNVPGSGNTVRGAAAAARVTVCACHRRTADALRVSAPTRRRAGQVRSMLRGTGRGSASVWRAAMHRSLLTRLCCRHAHPPCRWRALMDRSAA